MRAEDGRFAWTRWAVGLSVALNLFFVAFLGAQFWRSQGIEGLFAPATTSNAGAGPFRRAVLRQLVARLPPEDGRVLRAGFVARLPELVRLQRQSVAAAEQVRADIAASPLDLEKLRTDMRAAREARQQLAPVIEEALLDVVPRMSDEGRRILSDYRLSQRR